MIRDLKSSSMMRGHLVIFSLLGFNSIRCSDSIMTINNSKIYSCDVAGLN
jgi:hypothetical protein